MKRVELGWKSGERATKQCKIEKEKEVVASLVVNDSELSRASSLYEFRS